MIFQGANSQPTIKSNQELDGYKNYFIGNDPSNWVAGAKSYKSVTYTELYNLIDMEIYSEFEWMKYDFVVHPGGNPNDIKINYKGVDQLFIENNELVIQLSTGDVKEVKLRAYQNINGNNNMNSGGPEDKNNDIIDNNCMNLSCYLHSYNKIFEMICSKHHVDYLLN